MISNFNGMFRNNLVLSVYPVIDIFYIKMKNIQY